MVVSHSAPRSLGVEQLMYVGDDGVPAEAFKPMGPGSGLINLAVAGGLLAVFAKKHPALRAVGGILALAVGVRYAQSQ